MAKPCCLRLCGDWGGTTELGLYPADRTGRLPESVWRPLRSARCSNLYTEREWPWPIVLRRRNRRGSEGPGGLVHRVTVCPQFTTRCGSSADLCCGESMVIQSMTRPVSVWKLIRGNLLEWKRKQIHGGWLQEYPLNLGVTSIHQHITPCSKFSMSFQQQSA